MKITTYSPLLVAGLASAQSCSPTLTANYPAPSLAKGYVAQLVAQNLTRPRGMEFDSNGALLVVEQGVGISVLSIASSGNGCLRTTSKKSLVSDTGLNHGIQLDGSTLYASTGETVYSWRYSAASQRNTSAAKALVTGMAGSDHTTRTLMLSKKAPGMIVVNRGSNSNIDTLAMDIKSGHAQVKAFNITGIQQPYDFNKGGKILGWGLRNDVGIAEEPTTGKIFTVENSADQLTRFGVDVHQNNPAEEMNMLGFLDGTKSPNQGKNFGYPTCFTAWQPSEIPQFKGGVGDAFGIGDNANDTLCAARQVPRLSFQAHSAPLDILFNPAGTKAMITFHGSWNRDIPVGYHVAMVQFAKGQPVAPRNSKTAAVPIMSNADILKCPRACFRPAGLAWDAKGRLFMSSDQTGEIWVITREDGGSVM